MASTRWLAIPVLVTLSAALFAACSSKEGPEVATAASSSSGAGGLGGAGGAEISATTGAGGTSPEAGPLTCPTHSYTTIKKGPCDLLAQNCPAGMTCKETQLDDMSWSTHCVLSNGLKGEGETCQSDEECRERLTCAAGRCAPVCCKATNAPCLGGICDLFIRLDVPGKVTKQVCHYAKACTLLVADACDEGYDCHIEDGKQGLATCVQPNAPASDLGYCSNINDCFNMEDCFQGKSKKQCHFYCNLDADDGGAQPPGLGGCPSGQTCSKVVDKATVDFNLPGIGLCAPTDG